MNKGTKKGRNLGASNQVLIDLEGPNKKVLEDLLYEVHSRDLDSHILIKIGIQKKTKNYNINQKTTYDTIRKTVQQLEEMYEECIGSEYEYIPMTELSQKK